MGKVIEFKQTAESLAEAGLRFCKQRRFSDALDCLYRAYLKDKTNSVIMSDIAEVYTRINDTMLAVTWYIRALHADESNERVYPGLVKCYADMGYDAREAAYYYFAMGRSKGVMTPEELDCLAVLEEADEDEQPGDEETNVRQGDESLNDALKFQHGQRFLRENALSAAYILFATVGEDDVHYLSARRMMMRIDLERERFCEAAEGAEELLKKDEYDNIALVYGAAAYHKLGVKDKRDDFYARIDLEDEDCSCDDLETAAHVAWYIGNFDDALKYLKQVKNMLPWDRNILLKEALCFANMGEKATAKERIINLCRLYPDDLAVKYYVGKIAALGENEKADFEPLDTVPESEAIRREDMLDDWMVSHDTVSAATAGLKKNEQMSEYLDWLFQEGDTGLQSSIGKFLVQSVKWQSYFEELLICPFVSERLKKELLGEMFSGGALKTAVTTGNIYRKVEYAPPRKVCGIAEEAYRHSFVSLMFYGDGYTDDLNDVYERLESDILVKFSKRETDVPALAAAICYRTDLTRERLSKDECVSIFECDRDKFDKYVNSELFTDVKTLRKQTRPTRKRRV